MGPAGLEQYIEIGEKLLWKYYETRYFVFFPWSKCFSCHTIFKKVSTKTNLDFITFMLCLYFSKLTCRVFETNPQAHIVWLLDGRVIDDHGKTSFVHLEDLDLQDHSWIMAWSPLPLGTFAINSLMSPPYLYFRTGIIWLFKVLRIFIWKVCWRKIADIMLAQNFNR